MTKSSIASAFVSKAEIKITCDLGRINTIAMGQTYVLNEYTPEEPSADLNNQDQIKQEQEAFDSALSALLENNDSHQKRIQSIIDKKIAGSTDAEIAMKEMLEAEQMLLLDRKMISEIKKMISENNKSARRAVHEYFQEKKRSFEEKATQNPQMKDKMLEFSQVCEDIRRNLLTVMDGQPLTSLADVPKNSILITSRVEPKEMTNLIIDGQRHIPAMINQTGTDLDHTNVVASSIGIMVARLSNSKLWDQVSAAEYVIIDGFEGEIIINPSEKTIEKYQTQKTALEKTHKILAARSRQREIPVTQDGKEIKIYINAEFATEISRIHNQKENDLNVSGIGLYRTEFALLEHYTPRPEETEPKQKWEAHLEEKWEALFKDLAHKAGDKTLTIRTVDFEGDKGLSENENISEDEQDAIVRTQMRAAIKTKSQYPNGKLQLMIPTIRGANHFKKYQNMMAEEAEKLELPAPDLGAMAEIPSFIDTGIEKSKPDFVSIGSNDLIAHTLGYNRYKPNQQHHYDPTNRSFVKTLRRTFNKCSGLKTALSPITTFFNFLKKISHNYREKDHIPLSVCGDMASDPRYLPILIGCGITRLSCGTAQVPLIKEMVSRIDTRAAKKLVTKLIDTEDRQTREAILDRFNETHLGYKPHEPITLWPQNEWEKNILQLTS